MELKYLNEKRTDAQNEMEEILSRAKREERAMNEDEIKKFKELKKLIDEIMETIKAEETARETQLKEAEATSEKSTQESEATTEERAFVEYIKNGNLEQRANMTFGDNGAVIPQTIAKKIIENVKNLCPIYSLSNGNNKGEKDRTMQRI